MLLGLGGGGGPAIVAGTLHSGGTLRLYTLCTPPLLVVGRAITVASPAQQSFLGGVGALSPILWECVLVGVSSPSPPWSANIRSTSFGCRAPRIVRFVGGNSHRCPTHQNPSPQNDTVTMGGVYLPPAARLGPKLGRLAWGARNFMVAMICMHCVTIYDTVRM